MFVVSGLEPGGAETQLVRTAGRLAERGWGVSVLSFLPYAADAWTDELGHSRVRVCSLGSGAAISKYSGFFRARAVIRGLAPDVLVGFMFHGIITARVHGRMCRVPAIVSAIRAERDRWYRERLLRLTERFTDAVTVMSRGLATDLVRRRIAAPAHMHVIPNGVDTAHFAVPEERRFQVRKELAAGASNFLWLAAGRLVQEKDYPNLIRGFSELARRNARARLVIAGDGPLRDDLGSMVERLNLGDRVRFLGLRRDMPDLYAASDALVLSSGWEGMPGVVLEAMASKKPVVATSVGAVPELLAGDAGRFLVPPRDHGALADAMYRMMELSVDARNELAEAGYGRVRAEYSVNRAIDMWEDLFRILLARNGRDRRGSAS